MLLYRVSPVDPGAARGEPYHPGYVPASSGAHRVDNPEMYDTLYLSGSAAGAVAEAFGTMAVWGDYLTEHPRGFTRRLATFELTDRPVLDLDDPAALGHRSIRPARVVTRDRSTTQQWAAAAFAEGAWGGISWWSYYDPEWMSLGLWCEPSRGAIDGLDLVDTEGIGAGHPAVAAAERALLRQWS